MCPLVVMVSNQHETPTATDSNSGQLVQQDCTQSEGKKLDTEVQEMATHSSVLAWRIPWTEEPGGLQSMGSQRVGHDSGFTWVLEKAGKHQDSRLQKRTLSLGQPCWDSSAPFPVPTLFHSTQVLYLQEKELDRSRTDHTPVFVNDGGHRNYMCGIKPKIKTQGFPLAIQWLRLHSSNAGVTDLIPGQETKIPYAMQYSKKKKKKKRI